MSAKLYDIVFVTAQRTPLSIEVQETQVKSTCSSMGRRLRRSPLIATHAKDVNQQRKRNK